MFGFNNEEVLHNHSMAMFSENTELINLIEKIENPDARPQKIRVDGPLILRKSAKIHKGN